MDETRIVRGLRERDEGAFAQAVLRYSRLLWVVASRHLARADGFGEHDIEECIADVFFDLWQNNERYDPEKGSLKSYLCVLTSRRAISAYRRAAQTKVVLLDDLKRDEEPWYEELVDEVDYRDLYGAISALPEPAREILVRRYFYGEQPAAIAAKMQLPKKEVENRLYRAKRSLASSLPDRFKEAL